MVALAGLFASANGQSEITLPEYVLAMQIGEQYRASLHRFFDEIDNPQTENKRSKQEDEIMSKLHKYATGKKLPVKKGLLYQRVKSSLFSNVSATHFSAILEDMERAGMIVFKGERKGLIDLP